MSKVGIITFHYAHNYGAVLQAFALQEALKRLNYTPVIIDYKNNHIVNSFLFGIKPNKKFSLKTNLKIIIKIILTRGRQLRRYKIFSQFIKEKLTYHPVSILENENEFDCLIFGSDQIWNIEITKNDDFYFGDYNTNIKKISYGASAGKCENEMVNKLKYLKNFKAIGTREKSLTNVLDKIGIKNVSTVIDPTFLLRREDWDNLIESEHKKSKYILLYALRERNKSLIITKRIAKERNLKIIEIGAQIKLFSPKYRKETISPIQFINLIKNAEMVITTSFHGTVFSILYNRPFITVSLNDGEDIRSENLLRTLHLEHHLVKNENEIGHIKVYDEDYSEVNKKIEKLRKESLIFLSDNIG